MRFWIFFDPFIDQRTDSFSRWAAALIEAGKKRLAFLARLVVLPSDAVEYAHCPIRYSLAVVTTQVYTRRLGSLNTFSL